MYRSVISAHEDKLKLLVVENRELHEILTDLVTELSSLTHNCSRSRSTYQHPDVVDCYVIVIISVVLLIIILSVHPSVRLSVYLSLCPSLTYVLCDKMKEHIADILIPYERVNTLVF